MFLLKLALRPWRLAFVSQFFSVLAVACLLVMVSFLGWMQQGLGPVIQRMEAEQVVTAYLSASSTNQATKEASLVDEIHTQVGAHAEVTLVHPQEFLNLVRGPYPELAHDLEELGGELESIVPKYVSVTGALEESAAQKISVLPGVEKVESSQGRYQHVLGAFRALRWIGRLLGMGLVLALFTGLLHLARMNAVLHGDALHVLKLWGAGSLTLRVPGMLSALATGLAGGVLAAGAWVFGTAPLVTEIREISPVLKELPTASGSVAVGILLVGALLGLAAGLSATPETRR